MWELAVSWGSVPFVAICVLAVLGGLFLLTIIWMIADEWRSPTSLGYDPGKIAPYAEDRQEKAFNYLDNEVRGQMRWNNEYDRGFPQIQEPTLKGRVDMIEDHLGIKVEVKQAQAAKLVVKKVKK